MDNANAQCEEPIKFNIYYLSWGKQRQTMVLGLECGLLVAAAILTIKDIFYCFVNIEI